MKESAEKAKIELSQQAQTEINLPFITADASGPKHLQMTLNRSTFEKLTEDLVDRLRGPIEQAITDAGLTKNDEFEVVLVGGSTRMPMVQDTIKTLTNKDPNRGVNPDEVVAIGAALQAGVLAGEVRDVVLLDVTPLTLGVETLGGVMTPMIERNTTIPTRKSEIYSTAEANQSAVDIHVLQGERPMARDNMTLGRFRLEGIPAAPRGVPQVEVTFDIDANGILNVTAVDKATAREQSITITASTNLSKDEVERLVTEAESNRDSDEQLREHAELRNRADSLAYQAEKSVKEYETVDDATKEDIETKVKAVREALEADDVSAIETGFSELETALNDMATAMYAAQQAQAEAEAAEPSANGASEDGEGSDTEASEDEDVVEGEFREA